MKHLLIILILTFPLSAMAQPHSECLGEAVEVAIAYKISNIADGDCSNINRDGFMTIGEDRTNKKRFLASAIKGLDAGQKIPSRLFSSFEHSGEDVELDKTTICPVVSKRSRLAVKEMMKDCPDGAEMLQYILGKQSETEKVSDVELSTACHRVEKLKEQACRESKIVYHANLAAKESAPAKIKAPATGGTSASATAQ